MFRVTWVALGTDGHANFINPYSILGVTQTTPFEEIRARFHELTRVYHPDMPTGDPAKFRDINAAYRQIRADYRQQKANFSDTAFARAQRAKNAPNSGEFWAAQNEKIREANDRMAAARKRAEEQEAYARKQARDMKKGVFRRLYDYLYGAEIWLSLSTVVVVFVYAIERYYTMQKMITEKTTHLMNIDYGLPPMIPMEVDETLKQKYNTPIAKEELAMDAERVKAESQYRKATQRRFEDFREFMYVYDPDGIAYRKVTTERFSFQYMEEADIQKRCPIVKNFNSDMKRNGYEYMEKDLIALIEQTKWVDPDMGYAGALVAQGLGCIPVNSPNTAKWTFIEYVDTDSTKRKGKGKAKEEPVCMVAIRNHRFDKVGMCQRMTVTGRPGLVPELTAARAKELSSGTLKKKDLVTGGPLPIKDLSVPLKDMKL